MRAPSARTGRRALRGYGAVCLDLGVRCINPILLQIQSFIRSGRVSAVADRRVYRTTHRSPNTHWPGRESDNQAKSQMHRLGTWTRRRALYFWSSLTRLRTRVDSGIRVERPAACRV
jgi:hypothetical protein